MQCDQCGTPLHRDDARFCANCGAVVRSREYMPPPNGDAAPLSSAPPKHDAKKPLREQLARQPSFSSPAHRMEEISADDESAPDQSPAERAHPIEAKNAPAQPQVQGDQLTNNEQSGDAELSQPASAVMPEPEAQVPPLREATPSPQVVKSRPAPVTRDFERKRRSTVNWPTPITHVALNDNPEQAKEAPAQANPPTTPIPDALPANSMKTPPAEMPKRELHVKVWKQPDVATPPVHESAASPAMPAAARTSSSSPDITVVDDPDDAEHQPTRPLISSATPLRADAVPATPALQQQASSPSLDQLDTMQLPVQPQPHPITPLPPSLRLAGRPRGPLLLLAVVLPILIIGGLSLWIVLAQSFSFSPSSATQPWQSYNDPSLGMSFAYPNGWSQQVDRNKSIVQLNDSTHTAQVSVAVSNASSGSLNQFAQQQAKQFGLTTTKPAPTLSFGGATWQQMQGNTRISDANYSGSILSTTHGSRHYVIVQLFPLDNYSDEERTIFTPMHAFWKFHP
jgi:uncharacterized Zn finger protein (UPF0148 family)